MYSYRKAYKGRLKGVEKFDGEPIEHKIERIVSNKEPITDGAPSIYTERKDGVVSAYNIRTDRWEIAADAMDKVQASVQAKREEKASKASEKKAGKVVDLKPTKEDGAAEPTQGTK